MTLIITELSSYGIAMVADSAITMDIIMPITRVIGHRVYFGATKLRPIPKLEAGISFWGEGQIGDIDTDVWILNFIQRNEENYESLEDFATLLQDELREYVPEIIDPQDLRYGTLGFHLAGYENHNDDMLPTFWHIHNGQSETTPGINPRIINANHDLPPETARIHIERLRATGNETWPQIRNGDFLTIYAPFTEIINGLCTNLRRNRNVNIPTRNIKGRAEFLAFQIRTIRDLYGMSEDLLPSIGGNVAVLTITPEGIRSYFNPYDTTM